MFKKARIYFIIFFVALFQYGNTFEHDYAWDDAIVITGNDRVQQGLSQPSEFFRNIKGDEIQYRYGYRPISLFSFGLDIALSEMTPKTGHVMNVLYYALLCCLIFYFLRRMFPEKGVLFSAIVVGLFLIHPVHTEVVANIKSRDEILAMIFGMSSLIFYLSFLEKEKKKWVYAVLVIISLVLSFLSKENGITFTGVLLLTGYIKKAENVKMYLKFGLPLVGGIVLIFIRFYVYSDAIFENNATELIESFKYKEDGFLGNPLFDAKGYKEILPNIFYILMKDMGLMLLPLTLVHDYGFSHSTIVGWFNPLVIVSVFVHLGLIYLVIREFKKKSILLFGILFYFITLSVYLHIVQIGPDYMGERFLFIPSLGFLIAVVIGLERLLKTSFESKTEPIWKNKKGKIALAAIALLFILGFAKTADRNNAWENNETLFETDIVALNNCARAQYNYACLLHDAYYKNPSPDQKDKILYHYQRAVDISDRSMKAILDLGAAYMEFGQMDSGKRCFEAAIKVYPKLVAPYMQLGKYYLSQNNFEQALVTYKKAQKIANSAEIHYFIAFCLMKMNKVDLSITVLEQGKKLHPENYEYFELLSILRIVKKDYKLALISIKKAIEIAPDNQTLKDKRAWIMNSLSSDE